MKFVNRKKELGFLEEKWAEKKPQLIVVYGKRRVGKTELIKQFIKNKPGVYFLSDKRAHKEQLRELGRVIGSYFKDSILAKNGFAEWLDVFDYLKEKAKDQLVFVIDEYPYLVETDSIVTSLFQKGWDEYLKNKNFFMILSGSSVSMMESEALIYKSPLFGRRTGQIFLNPFNFKESWQFFPQKTFEDFLSVYTITGGMPGYLAQFDKKYSLEQNIKRVIFEPTGYLHNEVEFILKEELRQPKNYLSILRAIAWGKTKFGEIVNETGLQKNVPHKYLGTLNRLKLIEKEVPITEKSPQKSRKGIYKLSDNFFRFWFQYVFPYRSDLELGKLNEVLRKMKESFSILEAIVYERVCQEILLGLTDDIFDFERVGRWWEKDKEIDVLGLNYQTKEIVFGEAKWSNKPVGLKVFYDLKRKADSVQWPRGRRRDYFILFSKVGFEKRMKDLARKEGIFLVEKDKLLFKP